MRGLLVAVWIVVGSGSAGCRHAPLSPTGIVIPDEAPARSHREALGELQLHWVEAGRVDTPWLLVLHDGPGLDHTYLRPWLDPLARQFHLAYIDLRGHGRSDDPADASGYTLALAASDLAQWIDHTTRGAPVAVLGHGFGADVAMELAARHPAQVRQLILVGPLRGGAALRALEERGPSVLGAAGWRSWRALFTPQGTLRSPYETTAWLTGAGRLAWHRPPSPDVLQRLGRDVHYRAATDAAFRVDLTTWDAIHLAADVRAPTLVLSGDDDQWAPPADGHALADALPHGRWEAIANAGHFPFVEAEPAFIAAVTRFLHGEATVP